MTLTVLSTVGAALPTTFTVTVPKSGKLVDLTDALSIACSLRDDETLLVAEVYAERSLLNVIGSGGNAILYVFMDVPDRYICHATVMMLSALFVIYSLAGIVKSGCWYFKNPVVMVLSEYGF